MKILTNNTTVRPTNRLAPRKRLGSPNPRLELGMSNMGMWRTEMEYKVKGWEVEYEGTCYCDCDG